MLKKSSYRYVFRIMFIAKTIVKFDILHKCSFRSFRSDCLLHLTIVQVPKNPRPKFSPVTDLLINSSFSSKRCWSFLVLCRIDPVLTLTLSSILSVY